MHRRTGAGTRAPKRGNTPRRFAIEDDGDDCILPAVEQRLCRALDVVEQVVGRILRGHAGVDEADQVGNRVVAEDHMHGRGTVLVAVDGVEAFGEMSREPALAITCQEQASRAAQDSFVGCYPTHPEAGGNGNRLVRYAALGRPHALWADPEHLLVQIKPALDLLARILGMAKTVLRQGQARRRHGTNVRVAQQGKNRVIEGRRRNLDRTLLGSRGVCGENVAEQFPLTADHEALIVEGIVVLLAHQFRNLAVLEKKLVEPCDLGEDLQIGEVLRLKELFSALRRIPGAAKALPQLTVSRVAPDQVHRIRLKQVLQSETALFQR